MAIDRRAGSGNSWNVIETHDWESPEGIEVSLCTALENLDERGFSDTLYEYIDLDAVINVLDPTEFSHGASEVRFEYENYDIRIKRDGRIEAREQKAGVFR